MAPLFLGGAHQSLRPLSDSDATLGTEGRQARWMPYTPLPRSGRPLREYSRPADWYLLPLAILTKRTEILR